MVSTSWVFDVGCCFSGEWSADGGGCVVSDRQKIGLGGPSLFVLKTYDMVDDLSTNAIISWSYNGKSFVVWNQPEFCRDLLPQYFKHNNFSSFIRQLNTYGFRKTDPDQWEFANDSFTRGQRHILKKIHRKKPVFNHTLQNQAAAYINPEKKRELEDELERVKHDNTLLELQLQKYKHVFHELKSQQHILWSKVAMIIQKQNKIVTSFNNLKPQYPSLSRHKRKRSLPPYPYDDCEIPDLSSSQSSQSVLPSYLNLFEKLESSLLSWESFISEANECFFSAPEDDYMDDTQRLTFLSPPFVIGMNSNPSGRLRVGSGFDMNSKPGILNVFSGEESGSGAEVGELRNCVGVDMNVSPGAAS